MEGIARVMAEGGTSTPAFTSPGTSKKLSLKLLAPFMQAAMTTDWAKVSGGDLGSSGRPKLVLRW